MNTFFDRALLKNNAKMPLRTTYWMAFAVSLVAAIIMGINSGGGSSAASANMEYTNGFLHELPYLARVGLIWLLSIIGLVASIFSLLIKIFFINVVEIGHMGFYLENRKAPAKFTELFSGFKGNYIKKVTTMFMKNLFVSLWTLLFVIPGIIAGYRYWGVVYLINENPNLSWQHALDMSKRMTEGRKMDLFVLDLSFWGWYFLGALLCGVGTWFVHPYYYSTKAEAYEFIKQEALDAGRISYNEFNDMN